MVHLSQTTTTALTCLPLPPPASGALPSVPKPSAAPAQQPGMARSNGAAAVPPTAAGAAGAGISAAEGEVLRAEAAALEQQRQQHAQQAAQQPAGAGGTGGEGEGEEDETSGVEFKAAEAKLMKVGCFGMVFWMVEMGLEGKLESPGWRRVSDWISWSRSKRMRRFSSEATRLWVQKRLP